MGRKLSSSALAALAAALAIAGCGSSTQSATPVIRAADVTTGAPGYRLAGTLTLAVHAGTQTRTIPIAMNGSFDRRGRVASVTAVTSAGGHTFRVPELLSGLTVYMLSSAVPNYARLAGGKRWVELNMSHAISGAGFSSLPTATDPTQFVDYLRAVSSGITKVGGATVRGVATTHYHAIVDLGKYPRLVAPSQRPSVAAGVKELEAALGGHTIPLDVWIDGQRRIRRLRTAFGECISGVHLAFSMTADLFDYGPQPRPKIPPASQTYDLTPVMQAALRHVKFGCAGG